MALRGVAAIACTTNGRKAFLASKNHHFYKRSHQSPPHALHRFTSSSSPNNRTGYRNQIRAIQETTADPLTSNEENEKEQSPTDWKIKMLYDGDCPLCMREVNMLKERNKQYRTIKFVDISSDKYSPEENQGLDYQTVMGTIHAIQSDGTVVTNVDAFRRLYEHVGLGWVYAITKYEPIATIADAVYGVWAKYRLPITGRPPLEEILEARRKDKDKVCRDNDSCQM